MRLMERLTFRPSVSPQLSYRARCLICCDQQVMQGEEALRLSGARFWLSVLVVRKPAAFQACGWTTESRVNRSFLELAGIGLGSVVIVVAWPRRKREGDMSSAAIEEDGDDAPIPERSTVS